jgi:hypothetical protein
MNVGRGKIGCGMVLCQGVNLRAMLDELEGRDCGIYASPSLSHLRRELTEIANPRK